jgi:hypothetical protein
MIKLNIYNLLIILLTLTNSLIIYNKFCINCKYFINNDGKNVKYGKCLLFPKENNDFLVTGNKNDLEYYFCSTIRSNDYKCGVNGTLYKPKRKKNTL